MAHSVFVFRSAILGVALPLLALASPAQAGGDRPGYNRGVASAHQPIVSRTDYSFDAATGPNGLAPGEAQRLAAWLDGLGLGYGDRVAIDHPGGWQGDHTSDAVGAVLSRYGMLVSADAAPVNAGHPPAGSARIVVSRAVARVEGCPDWSRGNMPEFEGANSSNFGCASASNLAAMIADPQDLVHGVQAGPAVDARTTVKAVSAWRDMPATGATGLPGGVTSMSAVGGK